MDNPDIGIADADDRMVDTREAARITGYSKSTLEKYRSYRDDGPPFFKGIGRVLYSTRDLSRWMASNKTRCIHHHWRAA